MAKITVLPGSTVLEVSQGANLRTSLIEAGISVKSPCGGCASCGQCVVIIKDGKDNLSEFSFEEKQLLGNVFHMTGERLSCQTAVEGDVTVDVSSHSEVRAPKPKTQRRTKEEAEQVIEERKEKAASRPKKQGGFKKPKSF